MTGQGEGEGAAHTRGRTLMTVWSTESHRYDRPGVGAAHTGDDCLNHTGMHMGERGWYGYKDNLWLYF